MKTVKGIFSPSVQKTDANRANDQLSLILRHALGTGENMGPRLAGAFQLPGYTGSFGQGVTPEQLAAISSGFGSFQNFMGGDQGASALTALSGFAGGNRGYVPPEISSMLGNLPGSNVLGSIAGGNNDIVQRILQMTGQQGGTQDILSRLLNFGGPQAPAGLSSIGGAPSAGEAGLLGAGGGIDIGGDLAMLRQFIGAQNPLIGAVAGAGQINTPERQLLLQAAGQDPTAGAQGFFRGAQDIIGSLLPTAQTQAQGGGFDPASIFAALDQQRRGGLARNERDIRESLGTSGLRFSTNLADIFQQGRTESDANMMAEVARLMPQYAQTQQAGQGQGMNALLAAASQMGNLGQTAGQLGLGRQQNVLSGFGQAGQLGLGAGNANINALVAAMTGMGNQIGQQQGAAQAAGGMNLDAQNQTLQSLIQRMTGAGQLANQRTGIQADALSSLGNLNLGSAGQLLQALQSAGQLSTAQAGQQTDQMGQLNNLLQIMSGAAGQQGGQALQGQDILSRLFAGREQNALQAATALPGATAQIAGLPLDFATQMFNLSEGGRSIQDQLLSRMYQDFVRQNSLLPNVFSFLGGTPGPTYGASPWSQITGAVTDIGGMKEVIGELFG